MVVKEFVVTFLVALYVANVADSLSCIRCDERPCEVTTIFYCFVCFFKKILKASFIIDIPFNRFVKYQVVR